MKVEDKVVKLVKYLIEGQQIKIEGRFYTLSDNNELSIVLLDENCQRTDRVLEIKELGFSLLFDLANKLHDEDYFILGANSVLINSKNI